MAYKMPFLWREAEGGSVLILVAAIVFIVCLSLLIVPLYARLSVARAEQQAVADATALAGANAVARARMSLGVLDAIDYKFTEYIATASVLLAAVIALTAVPYVGEIAVALIEPVTTILNDLVDWKTSFDSHVGDPSRRGIRRIAPYYSMAVSARVATGNGYTGMAIPLSASKAAPDRAEDSGGRNGSDTSERSGREASALADRLAETDRQVVRAILACRPAADRLASLSDKGLAQVTDGGRHLQLKLIAYAKVSDSLGGSSQSIDTRLLAGKQAVERESEVVAALATLLDAAKNREDTPNTDLRELIAALKVNQQHISSLTASRGALLDKFREISRGIKDTSDEQVRALAKARNGLAQAQVSDMMSGEEGVVAVVFKKRVISRVPSGGMKINSVAIAAAKPLVNPNRTLDLWGSTELMAESKIPSGITTVAKMLRAGDQLLGWVRSLGDAVLSLLGNEAPELHVYEPVLVNTASVGATGDKIGKLLKDLHKGRDSFYGSIYVPVEEGMATGREREFLAAAKSYWRPMAKLINQVATH